jgi:hypothetical protein
MRRDAQPSKEYSECQLCPPMPLEYYDIGLQNHGLDGEPRIQYMKRWMEFLTLRTTLRKGNEELEARNSEPL